MTCHGGLTFKTQWARQTELLVFCEETWRAAQSQWKTSHTRLWSVPLWSTPQLSGTQPYKLISQHWSRCRDERLAMSVMTTISELQDVSPRWLTTWTGNLLKSDAGMKDLVCCTEFSTTSLTYPLTGTYKSAIAVPEDQPNSSKRGFQMLHIPTPSFQEQCGIGTSFQWR